MPGFFIHIADPTYFGGDFPFGRRLGPFLTEAEAVNQAVADVATGMGSVLGVYNEEASERLRTEGGVVFDTDRWYVDKDGERFKEGFDSQDEAEAARVDLVASVAPAVSGEEIDRLADSERARRAQDRAEKEAVTNPDHAAMWDALEADIKDPELLEIARHLRGRTM